MWSFICCVWVASIVTQTLALNFVPLRCTLPMNAGYGNLALLQYYYDAATGQCKRFTYRGIGGNLNRFRFLSLCKRVCSANGTPTTTPTTTTTTTPTTTTTTTSPSVPVLCSLKVDAGPCRALLPRFYYDADNGTCRRFFYGGCLGNANNFFTLELCQNACENIPAF